MYLDTFSEDGVCAVLAVMSNSSALKLWLGSTVTLRSHTLCAAHPLQWSRSYAVIYKELFPAPLRVCMTGFACHLLPAHQWLLRGRIKACSRWRRGREQWKWVSGRGGWWWRDGGGWGAVAGREACPWDALSREITRWSDDSCPAGNEDCE